MHVQSRVIQEPPYFQKTLINSFKIAYSMRLLLNKYSLQFQTILKIFDPATGHAHFAVMHRNLRSSRISVDFPYLENE